MKKYDIQKYYSNPKVLDSILEIAKNREVVGRFKDGSYSNRPNIVQYHGDILKMVEEGIVSFHGSVERYSNPMLISTNSSRDKYDQLRTGWDLILDIDAVCFEHSKIVVKLLDKALKFHGVENYGLKFSGRRGWHIFIGFEAFPEKLGKRNLADLYPQGLQFIVKYLKEMIKEDLKEGLIKLEGSPEQLFKAVGLNREVLNKEEIDPFDFVEVEENWGRRHLFRLPYSLHEKSWLVSVPLELKKIDNFDPIDAKPENASFETDFLKESEDARILLINAFDWYSSKKEKRVVKRKKYELPKKAISQQFFPPCIQKISAGLRDGRKRAVFILINFLKNMGWDWEQIEKFIYNWNEENDISLRDNYIQTQIEWHKRQSRNILPPNCDNELFYTDTHFCKPDEICKNIKNPLTYPWIAIKRNKRNKVKKKDKEK